MTIFGTMSRLFVESLWKGIRFSFQNVNVVILVDVDDVLLRNTELNYCNEISEYEVEY